MLSGKIRISILVLIIANIIWGAEFPIYKIALKVLPVFTFAFFRFFLAALFLLPFVYKDLDLNRKNFWWLLSLGLISVAVVMPFLFFGLKLSPSINAPIIISAGPIFLIISSWIFLKEKITPKLVLGTLISFIGVMAIVLRPMLDSGGLGSILGNLFLLIVMACSVIQSLIIRKLSPSYKPLVLVFWMFFLGALPLLPLVMWESQTFDISSINLSAVVGLLYGIFMAGILSHYFLSYGLKYIKASEVGIFSYVDPIATIVIAIPLLHETITAAYLIGAFLVFFGIFIAEGRIHYHPLHKLFEHS